MNLQQKDLKHYSPSHKQLQDLYLRISINNELQQIHPYPITTDFQKDQSNNILNLKIDTILKIASSIIMKKKLKVNKFLNIFVQIDKRKVNIFKIKKFSQGCIGNNILKIKRQQQAFYLDIWIVQVGKIQANPLFQLSNQKSKYTGIIQKVKQINQMFTKQLQSFNDQQKRSYDIAYLFAQPLVQPQQILKFPQQIPFYQNMKLNQYMATGSDVSFQKQYDKFIKVLKNGEFFSNITIEMMVATENNIRQVLNERCNILHFSCHGENKYLKIEKDKNIGYLDGLTSQRLIKLLTGKTLPKIILFNACFSKLIAQQINQAYPQITTIGYDGEANDKYCQLLTERLYQGIYKHNKSISLIYDEIKHDIARQNQAQASKLLRFKSNKQASFNFQKNQFAINQRWNIDWSYLQNLGDQQPFGIKKKLYEFIRDYLVKKQNQIIFVVGEQGSGKTIFVKKATYFTAHRNLFQQKLQINCMQGQMPIVNMLLFKLKYKKALLKFMREYKQSNILIVIDHCNFLVRNQPQEFFNFLKKLQKQIKFGKIILVLDHVSYLLQINVIKSQNVYFCEQLSIKKMKQVRDGFLTYLGRWHSQIKIDIQLFQNNRLSNLMKALRNCHSNEVFLSQLNKVKQQELKRENQNIMVDLSKQFQNFRTKIVHIQKLMKQFITYGYYSRNQNQFILISIFPQFPRIRKQPKKNTQPIIVQHKPIVQSKDNLITQINSFYQSDIKYLLQNLIQVLGKFRTTDYPSQWFENNIFFMTEKIFVIIGVLILLNQSKLNQPKELEIILFDSYTLIVKLFNRYQKLFSQLSRLNIHCESVKLKIYMCFYNFYKQQYFNTIQTEKICDKRQRSQLNNNRFSNQQQDRYINNDFFSLLPKIDDQDSLINSSRANNNNTHLIEMYNQRDSIDMRDIVSQRDSFNPQHARQSIRQSINSQRGISVIHDRKLNQIQQSSLKQNLIKNKQQFLDFDKQLKDQYGKTQYWQLIEKVQQIDTMIRKFKSETLYYSQQSLLHTLNPSSNSFFTLSSSSENSMNFDSSYTQIQIFYTLFNRIQTIYQAFADEDHFLSSSIYKLKKVFFSTNQLDSIYLFGLKLIQRLFNYTQSDYLFDHQQWYKQKLKSIRQKLIKAQKIIDHNFNKKLNIDHDLSYKKLYRENIEFYIDLRFKLEKLYSSFAVHSQKQLLNVFQKLSYLSEDIKSLQLKNRIEEYMEKYFYNKCTILISEPLGYVRNSYYKDKKKDNDKRKDNDKKKDNQKKKGQKKHGNSNKKNSKDSDYIKQKGLQVEQKGKNGFIPLNIYRNSDLIRDSMKRQTQLKLKSQIKIQIQTFTIEKLRSFYDPNQEQDKKKRRLIYLIIMDCKQSVNHQSIFLQNQHGQSVKYKLDKLFRESSIVFPYAPVIIVYGSNTDDILKQFYRDYTNKINKKMVFISFQTDNLQPQIEGTFMQLQSHVWNQFIGKNIGLSFLSKFWTRFCQCYFDQQHQTFQKQATRAFNIAKHQSLILTKKQFLQGLSMSQIEGKIDKIAQSISLQFFNVDPKQKAINLNNNLRSTKTKYQQQNLQEQIQQNMFRSISSAQNTTIRRQQNILALQNHQIGANQQCCAFLQEFYDNLQIYQNSQTTPLKYVKTWIKYHPQINQTNLWVFTRTIYHKFLRSGNRFELGVEFKDMTSSNNGQNADLMYHLFEQEPINNYTFGQNIQFGLQNQMRESMQLRDSLDYFEKEPILNKKKKIQIYYNVPEEHLKKLIEAFTSIDNQINYQTGQFSHPWNKSTDKDKGITFRLLIVDSRYLDQKLTQYLKDTHLCKISSYNQKSTFIENLYQISNTALNYSGRIQGFNIGNIVKFLYNKKQNQQQVKKESTKKINDRLIQYFQRNSSLFSKNH